MEPIVNQPQSGGGDINSTQPKYQPPSQQQSRLHKLEDLNELLIKQEASYLEVTVGVDTPNRYHVFNATTGENLYFVGEMKADDICCGGVDKPFKVALLDMTNRRVILEIQKPSSCLLYLSRCGCCCCGNIGGKLVVKLGNGDFLGEILHNKCSFCCKPSYEIFDENKVKIMTFGGPVCGDCCYCSCGMWASSEFAIRGVNGNSEVGKIYKKFRGFRREITSNSDTFHVTFPKEMDVTWKGLLLAAVFFIDNMYYESKPYRPQLLA